MIVGVTGGIGTGKSTVVSLFKKLGNIAVYTADDEAKNLMNTSKLISSKIKKEFGDEAYKNDVLNRPFLANIVFKDKEKLAKLNAIVHPEVANHFKEFVKNNQHKLYVLYENAILFENKSDSFCDVIITVTAPLNIRLQRLITRDNTTKEAVLHRIKNQWSETKKILQSNYIVENKALKITKEQVSKIHHLLVQKKNLY